MLQPDEGETHSVNDEYGWKVSWDPLLFQLVGVSLDTSQASPTSQGNWQVRNDLAFEVLCDDQNVEDITFWSPGKGKFKTMFNEWEILPGEKI